MPPEVPELQTELTYISKSIRKLKKKSAAIKGEYVPYVKNPLMGFLYLWGKDSLRDLGHSRYHQDYRDLYFRDIRYRSKLRKLNDRISELENNYRSTLRELKAVVENAA